MRSSIGGRTQQRIERDIRSDWFCADGEYWAKLHEGPYWMPLPEPPEVEK